MPAMMTNNFQTINTDNQALPENLKGAVVAIGNFDGFHRGHRAVVDVAVSKAAELNCPAVILTFDPHPRTWFNPKQPVYILTPPELKSKLANSLGFSAMAVHTFDKAFSSLSAGRFISEILLGKLGAKHIVTGQDFHFGSKRTGTPQYLKEAGQQHGFGVTLVDACTDENSQIISSSRIRDHLARGELAQANGLLGYAYRITGTVIVGQKMGRKLGFPTANIALPENVKLRHGIYAVRVIRANGGRHEGVASYGRRPTFDNGEALFETFLFEFDEDLYDEKLTVVLYAWLRPEKKFENVDDLVEAMKIDKRDASRFLSTLPPDHLIRHVGSNEI